MARVRTERHGPAATVVLDSPENRNALSRPLLEQLHAALEQADADPVARCVVLTATGDVFCSGADLRERRDDPAEAGALLTPVLAALAAMNKPVLARVNGHARGGGLGLIASCDLAAAGPAATFALSEVRVGVAPAMVALPLLRVMGRRAFLRYALTGESFGAEEAVAAGLLTEVVDDLDGWVGEQVAAIGRGAPGALAATKALPAQLEDMTWDQGMEEAVELSARLFSGPEAAEGMAAFVEKRPPSWAVPR